MHSQPLSKPSQSPHYLPQLCDCFYQIYNYNSMRLVSPLLHYHPHLISLHTLGHPAFGHDNPYGSQPATKNENEITPQPLHIKKIKNSATVLMKLNNSEEHESHDSSCHSRADACLIPYSDDQSPLRTLARLYTVLQQTAILTTDFTTMSQFRVQSN